MSKGGGSNGDKDGDAEAKEEAELERPVVNNSDHQQSDKEKNSSTDKDKKSNANQILNELDKYKSLSISVIMKRLKPTGKELKEIHIKKDPQPIR